MTEQEWRNRPQPEAEERWATRWPKNFLAEQGRRSRRWRVRVTGGVKGEAVVRHVDHFTGENRAARRMRARSDARTWFGGEGPGRREREQGRARVRYHIGLGAAR